MPEENGELAEELPASAYYLRFNESLHDVQSFLASLDVQFDIIDTEEAAFRTVKMSGAVLRKIKDKFAIDAVYKINGAE